MCIEGTIPLELCSSTSISIDVSDTGIACYSGCLTSSEVLIVGASNDCHDGSIMREFLMVLICVFIVALGFTFTKKIFPSWDVHCMCVPRSVTTGNEQ